MNTDLRIKLLSSVLIVLTLAAALFFWQQRPSTVTLGAVGGERVLDIPGFTEAEPDPDAPLVLSETGEMVPARTPRITGETIDTIFACLDGRQFTTGYDMTSNALRLTLSDGTEHILPQATAATGARYAKWDESVIFYEEAGAATVTIANELRYEDCSAEL